MQTTTTFEFARPKGWQGEPVDMSTYDGEVDYFELDVEGDVYIEIDNNYGADADGNRGVYMTFSYVDGITVCLDGDFRPLFRKVRDFFILAFLRTLRICGVEKYGRTTPTACSWQRLSLEFSFKEFGEEILNPGEREAIQEALFEAVDFGEPDYDF
jgi:hypothetical protein